MNVVPIWESLRNLLSRQKSVDNSFVYSLLSDAEAGRESALPFLFPLIFDADARIRTEVVEAVIRLTEDRSPEDWRRLDVSMRWHSGYSPPGFPKITPQSLDALAHFEKHQCLLLGLASMNGNGYVRQEAVRRLTLLSDGELPFLLMRLNDWVKEIRQDALDACIARIQSGYAARYLAALPLVLVLAAAGRNDFRDFIASVERLLTRSECRPVLLNGFFSPDPVIRRASFRSALTSADEDAEILFEQALLSRDPVVRRNAARLLRDRPSGDSVQIALLDRLSRDPLAAIRSEYLILCSKKYPECADLALRDALLDPHPSVRSTARYYLCQREIVDFAAFYLAAAETPDVSHLAAAIAGLGETGNAVDAAKIVDFLDHPTARVRRAAVVAVGRLNGEAEIPRLLHALHDESARVARAAREALVPHVHLVSDEALWSTFKEANLPHSHRIVLSLMYALPNWRAFALLLQACSWLHTMEERPDADPHMAMIIRWLTGFNGSGILPTRRQLEVLQEHLRNAETFLAAKVADDLRRVVQSAERSAR
jgi:HEAT repeat protein